MSAAASPPRYLVGIDLGTTNSAVAFVDTKADTARVEVFSVAQLVAPGEIEARTTLPSFYLEPAPGQFDPALLRLPWDGETVGGGGAGPPAIVGVLAREQGTDLPGRLIVSAKSWLSHGGVDRTADLLPWHGAEGVRKLSPAQASARYLRHLRAAWDHAHPADPLESQEVVITIPASFDEVARELTAAAVRLAGLRDVALIEEPQAAFYTWMNRAGDLQAPSQELAPGQMVLICDVGGGTTDFTLIEVTGAPGEPRRFRRTAVGDHLILGGDNLDLALAHHVENRLAAPLSPRAWSSLLRRCQQAKEILLGPDAPERLGVSVGGGGARLLWDSRLIELARDEVTALLLDGFLPLVPPDAEPVRRSSGFQELGLPYAADPGITRHLASFLRRPPGGAGQVVNGLVRPDAVLFNGGFFAATAFRERLRSVLGQWFGADWRPIVLDNPRLDLAVAEGAVHFALARRGVGAKVAGGLGRSYYLGVAGPDGRARALCLAPAGLEEDTQIDVPTPFELLVRQPAEFPLYASSVRTGDPPGALVPLAADGSLSDQFVALPPVRTALASKGSTEQGRLRVTLHVRLTAIGTLDIWCAESGGRQRRWNLTFDLRGALPGNPVAMLPLALDEAAITQCRERVQAAFGRSTGQGGTAALEGLAKRLEEDCGLPRLEWPLPLLRALWQELIDAESGRSRSPAHEARWLNLLGFCLRPGLGFPVDDWRCAQTWRLYEKRLVHHRSEPCRAEWWILWRRIAGGLTAGQQRALAAPLLGGVIQALARPRGFEGGHESAEIWRLLGSLEALPVEQKIPLGDAFLHQLRDDASPTSRKIAVWVLGRLGAREPLHGQLNTVVDPTPVRKWVHALLAVPGKNDDLAFAILLLTRRTGDRFRDVDGATRTAAAAWLNLHGFSNYAQAVQSGGALGERAGEALIGERLPLGLRLVA